MPIDIDVERLCEQVKKQWPKELGDEIWYLAMVNAISI